MSDQHFNCTIFMSMKLLPNIFFYHLLLCIRTRARDILHESHQNFLQTLIIPHNCYIQIKFIIATIYSTSIVEFVFLNVC